MQRKVNEQRHRPQWAWSGANASRPRLTARTAAIAWEGLFISKAFASNASNARKWNKNENEKEQAREWENKFKEECAKYDFNLKREERD